MPVPQVQIPDLSLGGPRRVRPGGPPVMRTVSLGRTVPDQLPPVLSLTDYLRPGIRTIPPDSVDYAMHAPAVVQRMYANDRFGCCVISSKYHHLGVQHAVDSPLEPRIQLVVPDKQVVDVYRAWCGPGDNGCYITRVLDKMKTEGLPFGADPHRLDAWVRIDPRNHDAVKMAIHLFGGVCIGLSYLAAWQRESVPGGVWDDVRSPSLGGHDVYGAGYDPSGVAINTWGYMCWLTWRALANPRLVDECYVLLGPDWYQDDRLSPAGLDVDRLRADLAVLGAGGVPPMPTPPTPPTPPNPDPVPPPNPDPTHPTLGVVLTGHVTIDGEQCPIVLSGTAGSLAAVTPDVVELELESVGVHPEHAPEVARRLGVMFARDGLGGMVTPRRGGITATRPDTVTPGQWWQVVRLLIEVARAIADILGGR